MLWNVEFIHVGRKPYSCEVCSARFSDPSSKRRHEKEHVGSKPYVCQLCFESFKRGGQLKTHLSRKHTNQKDEAQVIQKDGLLQFIYKDGNSQSIPVYNHSFIVLLFSIQDNCFYGAKFIHICITFTVLW
jgi:hypothetical protein